MVCCQQVALLVGQLPVVTRALPFQLHLFLLNVKQKCLMSNAFDPERRQLIFFHFTFDIANNLKFLTNPSQTLASLAIHFQDDPVFYNDLLQSSFLYCRNWPLSCKQGSTPLPCWQFYEWSLQFCVCISLQNTAREKIHLTREYFDVWSMKDVAMEIN